MGGPGGSALFAFFCNFLLQVPAEYDINGVLKCFEREVLQSSPFQERTGRRLQAGLSGAAVFAREQLRGNAQPGHPPLWGNECAAAAAKLGGTTEVLCLSSLSFGMKGIYFFPERIPLLKEESHGQKLVKGIHH